jgi:hypothetical protein
MAPRGGVEPPTLRLGGTRSIHLSYRGRVFSLTVVGITVPGALTSLDFLSSRSGGRELYSR